ncbi:hypothetical protein BJX99DRAFT_246267 [Aspergillus californicus]
MSSSNLIPALPPPPGYTSNFVNPYFGGTKFIVVNCVFLPVAFVALGIRLWTRTFIARGFRSDDGMSAVTLDMLKWGLGVHMWNVLATDLSPMFLKLNLVAAIIYCAGTGFLKVSVLLFYLRIFPSRGFQSAVWTLVFIAAAYNVASVLANLFSCTPVAKTWDSSITSGSCMNRPVFYFANAGLGIFTDFATVLVPVPWLRRLQMPMRQKIAVGCILAMGCFVGVVSCIRLSSLYILLKDDDLTWDTTNALMWCVIELNLGITGGCVTAMRPFARRYFPRLLGLSSKGSTSGYPSQSRGNSHPLHSIPRSGQPDFSNHSRHQYSTTLKSGADNSSEEHILGSSAKELNLDGILHTVDFDVKKTGERS